MLVYQRVYDIARNRWFNCHFSCFLLFSCSNSGTPNRFFSEGSARSGFPGGPQMMDFRKICQIGGTNPIQVKLYKNKNPIITSPHQILDPFFITSTSPYHDFAVAQRRTPCVSARSPSASSRARGRWTSMAPTTRSGRGRWAPAMGEAVEPW
jgi:hypothetical protein